MNVIPEQIMFVTGGITVLYLRFVCVENAFGYFITR